MIGGRRGARLLATGAVALVPVLGGCDVDVSAGSVERNALLAPDIVAAAAARATDDPQAKWLLRRPRAVRESYVRDVLDARGDRDLLSTAWLLRQPDGVRESYVREVVEPRLEP